MKIPSTGVRVTTPTDTTIVMTRTFNAPCRLVWEAMTNPARMRRWMLPPPGLTMTICECDARVGGALSLAWKSDDVDPFMTLRGTFTEVVPHERMVHTEVMLTGSGEQVGSLVETHEFAEKDGVTEMRITQVYGSKDARDCALEGMGDCMEAGYKQLDAMFT